MTRHRYEQDQEQGEDGGASARGGGVPGKSTLTSRLGASPASIGRAVAAALRRSNEEQPGGELVADEGDEADAEAGVEVATMAGGAGGEGVRGTFPWARNAWYSARNFYRIHGTVSGGGGTTIIDGPTADLRVTAGSSGVITLELRGEYAAMAGGGLMRNPAGGTIRLFQTFPYRCAADGTIVVDTAAIIPGSGTNDPSHTMPAGIGESEIGVSFSGGSDGSSFLFETITFTNGGKGVAVGIGRYGVETSGGATSTHSVGIRVNLYATGAIPAVTPPAPQPSAVAIATTTVVAPSPVRVTPPPMHTVYFQREGRTEGDEGELVRWAAALPAEAQDAIRDHRLSVTVLGYASTTGSERKNLQHYSARRAEWVRGVLARTLAVDAPAIHVGALGEFTAPAEDRATPAGVANPSQLRAEIRFAEVNPTTPGITSTTHSATAPR